MTITNLDVLHMWLDGWRSKLLDAALECEDAYKSGPMVDAAKCLALAHREASVIYSQGLDELRKKIIEKEKELLEQDNAPKEATA